MNKINLYKLSLLQKKLDLIILDKHKITNELKIRDDKILALIVEIGELSNETMCFKFWKSNKNIDFNKVREEFSDCLHFILSLGNILKYDFKKYTFLTPFNDLSSTKIILRLAKYSASLIDSFTLNNYTKVLNCMFLLADDLQINHEMLKNDYIIKNKINIERQKDNY